MTCDRRAFLSKMTAAAVASTAVVRSATVSGQTGQSSVDDQLKAAAETPLLEIGEIDAPLVIESMELLRIDNEFLVRTRTKNGLEAVVVANSSRLRETYPVFIRRVAPFFVGKDARKIESLLFELYRASSNYKWQGLAFWVCVAAAEMSILELLGKAADKSIGELFGGVLRRDIPVYRASGNRGNRPEEEIEYLRGLVAETGASAIKFRLGGRMSRNADSLPGRSERLIPLVRDALGPDMTLYADANSSYDVDNGIRIGRIMEKHDYAFFEEPCPFDHLWETQQVTDALDIPVAGGEQEFSMRRFRWAIQNAVMDVVQPDLHYFGGFIRCTQVARMADVMGLPCTVHMSGAGLGYLYVIHFASYVKDPGAHQEFKGTSKIPMQCDSSDLQCHDGSIRVPSGRGFGVEIDPAYVKRGAVVEA